ncbi:MAG: proline dehydrogenase family protein [Ardenticatenaceae bacterium]|nr:proline dehydrogenase family protein [Ardenticatenaceae bacterium]
MTLEIPRKKNERPAGRPEQLELDTHLAEQAVALAAELLQEASQQQTPLEKAQGAKIAGMMEDPEGKVLTLALTDQAFRARNAGRIANQVKFLVNKYGVPGYFTWWERAALRLGAIFGPFIPQIVVPAMVSRLRQETRAVILPSEEKPFKSYLQERRQGGTRLNINQLGEAILGEEEAGRRFKAYLNLLARPDVEYISVKISSIFSQINLVAYDETLEAIEEELRQLYRQAMAHQYVWPDGKKLPKFVNLDMEEYRDLHLTIDAFKTVLMEPEFFNHRAGIVLQAYLPDSFEALKDLTAWALNRVDLGGAPIKIRLVKGANLAMEKVEASLHGWEQAPYTTKAEVDANFKRMVTYTINPKRTHAVQVGIASHNLFDVAYALILQEKFGLHDEVEFEMLEGMANHQARSVQKKAGGLLLYAPIVKRDDFHSAISYLVRRLDENTAEENFLHDLFGLEVGSPAWEKQKKLFLDAYHKMNDAQAAPNRKQNRLKEKILFDPEAPFTNIPDTDFSLPANQEWVRQIRDEWVDKKIEPIPLQIGGRLITDSATRDRLGEGHDPAKPGEVAYTYGLADLDEINRALETAQTHQPQWAARPVSERKAVLLACATQLAKQRGHLLGAMMLDGGKSIPEADPELSEAIDFAHYYARSLDLAETELSDYEFSPFGTVLITPPWNFPLAIPCGGILSALMAGSAVIFKPAPEATLVGWELAKVLWDAGVPKELLQFVPTSDDDIGRALVTDPRVDAVILTGAYATGQMFLNWKPSLKLYAETSGKNSMIITALADHDQAIKDLVKSAFGHSGQKCSAASLAVLEAEVYDNPAFMRQLRDAAVSLKVGSQWALDSKVTPVIREPGPELCRAQTTLEPGESWLLEPKMIDGNPNLWSPGIKLGVKPGSWYHQTECFGPVLGLIRAKDIEEAVNIVNDSDFGLTSGLQSLDKREIAYWRDHIEVGNGYINRGTTGAIVQRQPFGGWKKSVFGYAKAGGPNYVLSLGNWKEKRPQTSDNRLQKVRESYRQAWENHFALEHDPSQILGESNVFRYRPVDHLTIRLEKGYRAHDLAQVELAAATCGIAVKISVSPEAEQLQSDMAVVEPTETFNKMLSVTERVRWLGQKPAESTLRAANEAHVRLVQDSVLDHGRLELRHYLREQSISTTTHRYGNIY